MKPIITPILLFILAFSVSSCSQNTTGDESDSGDQITNLLLHFDKAFIFENETVFVQVRDDRGLSFNHKAQFELNGVEQSSSNILFGDAGVYDLKVTVDDYVQSFSVEVFESTYESNVLVEDYTGAWCGYCPRVAYKLENLQESDSRVVVTAIHNGDQMHYQFESQMRQRFDISSFPTAKINRIHTWDEENGTISSVLNKKSGLGLALSSEWSSIGELLEIDVEVGEDVPYVDLKLVVYVQRNGMVHAQTNYYNGDQYSPFYGLGDPIEGFVHDHVLLRSLTDVFGDEISSEELTPTKNFTKTFQLDVTAVGITEANIGDFEFVAFVVNENDEVINVKKAKALESADF